MMKNLSKEEMMKVVGGGTGPKVDIGDGGSGNCLHLWDYGCSLAANPDPDLKCCPGLTREMNASSSGTICV